MDVSALRASNLVVRPVYAIYVRRNDAGDVVILQDDEEGRTNAVTVPRTEAANLARAIKEAAKGE